MTVPPVGSAMGRVAIVTGGSRGVGRAAVFRLAALDHAVVVASLHDQQAAEPTVERVLAEHGIAVAVRADVADELDVERLFTETIAAFGGVDAVVHAVGGRVGATPVAELDLDGYEAWCRFNTRAASLVNGEAARRLRDGGTIVDLVNSALGVAALTSADGLVRALAQELGERGITVNAVALEVGRPCADDCVVDIVMYLLSDAGHGLTGHVIRIVDPGASGTAPR